MRFPIRSFAPLAAAAAVVFAGPASAQATWNYAGFTRTGGDNWGNSYAQSQSGIKLTVSAFSTTGSGATFATAAIGNYGTGSGFGVKNRVEGLGVSSPQHSMDNFAHTDMLALNFTTATTTPAAVNMVLTQLTSGWHNTSTTVNCATNTRCGTDSDISLLRWDGGLANPPTIAGQTIGSLLSSGWTLVNSYSNMADDVGRNTLADTSKGSSWWLISAYNSAWGTCKASAATDCSKLTNGDDFVKVLSSVSALPTQPPPVTGVPEPGSMALAGLALLGACATRRRKTGQAAA